MARKLRLEYGGARYHVINRGNYGSAGQRESVCAAIPAGGRSYHGQLQHVLAVTGLSAIDFVCYFPPLSPICITIPRDDGYIDELLHREEAFWNELTRRREETRVEGEGRGAEKRAP